ncbi:MULTISPECIES: M1 family metallopeptidase [Caulobacter]|jgi:aminopeptidase N|uniref:M1 family metallopeptidase n=1 Tax=Caulobacter TaxID=75 RepID=UPI0006FA5A40|nr:MULTISPECIES: M1 family metallopeptidase [Caulobacter]KQZ22840.1 aminopeptidase [Caulobacter sp. Root1472]GGL41415.1 aminopeptidase [Caulobacter rhizosphaerae]
MPSFKSTARAALLALLLSGAAMPVLAQTPSPPPAILAAPEARDIHSYAQPLVARVTHIDLDLTADFAGQKMTGSASLDIAAAPDATEVVLDSKGLVIHGVTDAKGVALPWTLGKVDPILGAPLTVQLNGARRIVVSYDSAPGGAALQWLTPAQTAGKQKPYLFSQGEAILNRTWIPTQDSPGIRQTWTANILVPDGLTAVMSAQSLTPPEGDPVAGGSLYRFKMDKPVASYLIAIAVGDIAFTPLGGRTGVYTEPSVMKKTANELVDVEKMVEAAESLYGPYAWGRYDLLVLPPSFPFGGMENPRLTFATPTIIAGDRSLVSLVAHELAHSWSGNLVNNATWSDFWLNEGFTVYFENRIMEKLYGKPRADMLADLGWSDLQAAIKDAGGPTGADTRLHLDLTGRDPDDGMTDIAYEKGATFLRTIEKAVGRDRWDAYLKDYFARHAFQSQTTAGFVADLRANLIKGDPKLEAAIGVDQWVYGLGLPANAVHIKSAAFPAVDALAAAYAKGGPAPAAKWKAWSTPERTRFVGSLPRQLSTERLAALDKAFGLSAQGNSEIRFAWLELAVANRYAPAVPSLEAFLTDQGRRKFVAPLFKDLMAQGDWGQPIAKRLYARTRPLYHAVTRQTVDGIVK